ncbi:hypothetical protein [Cetobacterium sp.]|uniref:hypothetical protein n=1 Tax=Cetobacterium sp. TaxID=2071632 RepID=UPI003F3680B0
MINEKLKKWTEDGLTLTEITALVKKENLIVAKNIRDATNKRIKAMGFTYDKNTEKYLQPGLNPEAEAVKKQVSEPVPATQSLPAQALNQMPVSLTFTEVTNIFHRLDRLEKEMVGMKNGGDLHIRFDEDLLLEYPDKDTIVTSIRVNKSIWKRFNSAVEADFQLGKFSKTEILNLILAKVIEDLKK